MHSVYTYGIFRSTLLPSLFSTIASATKRKWQWSRTLPFLQTKQLSGDWTARRLIFTLHWRYILQADLQSPIHERQGRGPGLFDKATSSLVNRPHVSENENQGQALEGRQRLCRTWNLLLVLSDSIVQLCVDKR